MEKKMTYVEALNVVLEGKEITAEVIERLTALRDTTAKRNAKSDKPTKAQLAKAEADKALTETILAGLEADTDYTTAQCGEIVGVSASKAVHLMKPLVESGAVTKDTVKGSTVYRLA